MGKEEPCPQVRGFAMAVMEFAPFPAWGSGRHTGVNHAQAGAPPCFGLP
jgi:hypothetical protein